MVESVYNFYPQVYRLTGRRKRSDPTGKERFFMNVNIYISALIQYGLNKGLFDPCDRIYMTNQILEVMQLNSFEPAESRIMPLEEILQGLLADAVARGICEDDTTSRDLFDTKLMGVLTPPPREIRSKFAALYQKNPEEATEWYYRFSQDTDYIRRYRVQKDMRWKAATEYGNLDITINLSKPEKDPKAISAAKSAPQSDYPKCMLCPENEGYAGRMNHPARQNHRIIPVELNGESWNLQYSPYVYYPEHCIVFNSQHTPMVINKSTIEKLLDFVTKYPHYFIGSNADLPIVGGSILSHEHFQGGHYSFPMERAPIEREIEFAGFESVTAGIVKWPMSVLRLTCKDREALCDLATRILLKWRIYSDKEAFIFANSGSEPHNTITPIARRLFDSDGNFRPGSHGAYPEAVRKTGEKLGVPVIDLTTATESYLAGLGDEPSKPLFMFPKDNTHLKPEGAVVMAGFLAEGLKKLNAPYADLLAGSDEGAHG